MADKFVDTTPQGGGTEQYHDPAHIPEQNEVEEDISKSVVGRIAGLIAGWLLHKQWGVDVRLAMALMVKWLSIRFDRLKNEFNRIVERQSAVDQRQTDIEDRWEDQINGKVAPNEVVDARRPSGGNAYKTLGKRLDDMQSDPAKLKYMSLAVTYNSNEPNRYKNIIKQYQSIVTPISFVNMCSISSATASDVKSAPFDELQAAIEQAADAGYKIILMKPHVGPDNNDGFNKTTYMPDDTDAFFANYKGLLLDQAKLADANGIPVLCLETELNQLASAAYFNKWQDIVSAIRTAYPKLKLTVASAGAYNEDAQRIFNLVDYIGVNWYPIYAFKQVDSAADIPSEAELSQQLLTSHINDAKTPGAATDVSLFLQMADKFGKPIWLTETGVMPKPDGLATLLSKQTSAIDNYSIVAAAMRTMAHTLGRMGPVIGINWWHAQEPFNPAPEDGKTNTTEAQNTWKSLIEEMTTHEP